LIYILVVSVLLRIAAAIYFGNTVTSLPGTFDQISYHKLALRLLDGHGFSFGEQWWPATPANEPTAHWSFLYTLLLTAVYSVTNANPIAARLLQAVLVGIFMPWLVYRVTLRLFQSVFNDTEESIGLKTGERIGLISAAITAVYAYFIYYAAVLMTEGFYIIAILWSFDISLQIVQAKENKRRQWLLLGLSLGSAVLLRQLFLLFIPFFLLWLWWAARPKLRYLVLPIAVVLLMMLPWTVRNFIVFDQFVLLNTNAGYAFFWGNHPIYGRKFIPILTREMGSYYSLIPSDLLHLNEAALDTALLKLAIKNVVEDPWRYLLLSMSRIPSYFTFWPSSESSTIGNLSRVASFGLFSPFMLVGLGHSIRLCTASLRAGLASPLFLPYLFVIFYTGIHVLTWTLIRYRLPVDAVLVSFAGLAIAKLLRRIELRREHPHTTPI
jgi:hypothetical protein